MVMQIERFKPDITFKGGKFVTVMKGSPDGEYVHMPDDGRPCHTDIFIARLLECGADHHDIEDALRRWNEGSWDAAMEVVTDYEDGV